MGRAARARDRAGERTRPDPPGWLLLPATGPEETDTEMPLFGLSASNKVFSTEHPGWHDPKKPAGHTSLLKDPASGFGYHSTEGWWVPIVKLQALFLSPNLVWLVISLAMYFGMPYNLDAPGGPKDGFATAWVWPRFAMNCGVTMAYVGYWYLPRCSKETASVYLPTHFDTHSPLTFTLTRPEQVCLALPSVLCHAQVQAREDAGLRSDVPVRSPPNLR